MQRPGHHGLELALVLGIGPGVGQQLLVTDLEDVAQDPVAEVQIAVSGAVEVKAVPDDRLEVVRHEPDLELVRIGQRLPDAAGRVRQELVHRVHSSIVLGHDVCSLSKKLCRSLSDARQNCSYGDSQRAMSISDSGCTE